MAGGAGVFCALASAHAGPTLSLTLETGAVLPETGLWFTVAHTDGIEHLTALSIDLHYGTQVLNLFPNAPFLFEWDLQGSDVDLTLSPALS